MNTGKRIPATLTAILAILALTSCDWGHIELRDKQ